VQQSNSLIDAHTERLIRLWEQMVRTVGIHTVNVLFERAVWEAAQEHPELALIQIDDAGLSFAALRSAYANQPTAEIDAAFSDLATELLLILARLLGKEMAQRLSEELQAKMNRSAAQSAERRADE
jgi:hypothetical protein